MQENILNSIPIENDYYKILPLKLNELSLLAYDVENFEQSLGYKYNYYLINQDMKNFLKTQIRYVLKNSSTFHFYTTWLIINKNNNEVIGFFSFKDYNKLKRNVLATISVNSSIINLDPSYHELLINYLDKEVKYQKLIIETNSPSPEIYNKYLFQLKDINLFTTTFEKRK